MQPSPSMRPRWLRDWPAIESQPKGLYKREISGAGGPEPYSSLACPMVKGAVLASRAREPHQRINIQRNTFVPPKYAIGVRSWNARCIVPHQPRLPAQALVLPPRIMHHASSTTPQHGTALRPAPLATSIRRAHSDACAFFGNLFVYDGRPLPRTCVRQRPLIWSIDAMQ